MTSYTSPTDFLTQRLREDLKALDDHDNETRRLLDIASSGVCPPSTLYGRTDARLDLSARVIETARALSVVLP